MGQPLGCTGIHPASLEWLDPDGSSPSEKRGVATWARTVARGDAGVPRRESLIGLETGSGLAREKQGSPS